MPQIIIVLPVDTPPIAKTSGRNLRVLASLLCFYLCLVGCKNTPIWSAEAKSPNQEMIAKAETVDNGGFGTSFTQTAVFLNWVTGSQKPKLILSFSDGPNIPGGMNLGMNWLSDNHLELVYKGARPIDFEAIRCDGIDITVRDVSTGTTNASQ